MLGEYRLKKEWHKGQHAAIVDVDTWTNAQRLAEQSRRYTPKGGGRLPARHLFVRGSLRCVWCEAAMLPRTDTKTGRETYQCARAKTKGRESCPFPILRREDVEGTVLRYFEEEAFNLEKTRDHVAAQLGARTDEAQSRVTSAERAAAELRTQLGPRGSGTTAGEPYRPRSTSPRRRPLTTSSRRPRRKLASSPSTSPTWPTSRPTLTPRQKRYDAWQT